MGRQIEGLARFVAHTQWEDIPAPVQRHAKLVFLDTLGVILAGSERPEVRQLRERLAATAGSGATVLAGGPASSGSSASSSIDHRRSGSPRRTPRNAKENKAQALSATPPIW